MGEKGNRHTPKRFIYGTRARMLISALLYPILKRTDFSTTAENSDGPIKIRIPNSFCAPPKFRRLSVPHRPYYDDSLAVGNTYVTISYMYFRCQVAHIFWLFFISGCDQRCATFDISSQITYILYTHGYVISWFRTTMKP